MINDKIELGVINTLRIDRITTPGLYLMAENEEDVLLPGQYFTEDMDVDQEIDVFIYTDSEDRLVATTERPIAMKDQFGFFEVVDTTDFGAFVDWGLPKDLFVPKFRQKTPFRVGEKRIIRVVQDEQTERLLGVEKIKNYLSHEIPDGFYKNREVSLLVMAKTPLGYKCIVDHSYAGMLFTNEIHEAIKVGDIKKGYVKLVRKDGNLDIMLQPIGTEAKTDIATDKIITLLHENNNILPYNYKSDAELIKSFFGLSKKNYKRALTTLIDAGKIEVSETGIYKKEEK